MAGFFLFGGGGVQCLVLTLTNFGHQCLILKFDYFILFITNTKKHNYKRELS